MNVDNDNMIGRNTPEPDGPERKQALNPRALWKQICLNMFGATSATLPSILIVTRIREIYSQMKISLPFATMVVIEYHLFPALILLVSNISCAVFSLSCRHRPITGFASNVLFTLTICWLMFAEVALLIPQIQQCSFGKAH